MNEIGNGCGLPNPRGSDGTNPFAALRVVALRVALRIALRIVALRVVTLHVVALRGANALLPKGFRDGTYDNVPLPVITQDCNILHDSHAISIGNTFNVARCHDGVQKDTCSSECLRGAHTTYMGRLQPHNSVSYSYLRDKNNPAAPMSFLPSLASIDIALRVDAREK
jgi:hypothetical protein